MQEIHEKIWKIEGQRPGPRVTILGGVHGNERTGVEVIKQLQTLFENEQERVVAGTLHLILGNLRAIAQNTRGSEPGKDLNRRFNDRKLEAPLDGSYESERARQIAPFLRETDVCIDLHATNRPSEPMLVANSFTAAALRVYRLLGARHIISDPQHLLFTEPTATNDYTEFHGGIGVGYETGQSTDVTRVEEVREEMLDVLRDQGLLASARRDGRNINAILYQLTGKILLTEAGFDFAQGMGLRSFQPYKKGDVLGYVAGQSIVAQEDGVFVMPTPLEFASVGDYITLLAKKVS